MFEIDAITANAIVERTRHIIEFNINVMNASGVIIGSGDKQRLGETHEGALLAISQNRNVEITTGSSHSLQGVKPGVNLPLHYRGRIIGVIGITGEPANTRHYGEMLRMTAEVIFEQANHQANTQWQHRQQEEFILQLIKAKEHDVPSLRQWAIQLGVDLSMPRVAAIIEVESVDSKHLQDNRALKQIVYLLQNPNRGNLIAMTSLSQLVILKPAFLDGESWNPELESVRIDKLLKRIPSNMQLKLNIALGHYFDDELSIAKSYRTARETLQLGKKLHPQMTKYLFEDYSLQVLLSGLKHHWRGEALSGPFQKLQTNDKDGQLVKTFHAYINNLGDLKSCAESLYIHRNTLRYRLDKISTLTNTDINSFDGLLSLYLGSLISH
ncbi:CdaR family transcriptional regulator [Shewanella maritima]|uniref:CdaR family transcriptional regulator n=1 Tax=Shewanella maritima TaxID=2520507 RepID=A0A411PKT8_9GAMM|nr:sugar diacid recognition domain-containing protein [Shewanella maritima]QBF84124.1 CdaR family transcriptional regulator [Shewanella maritima]